MLETHNTTTPHLIQMAARLLGSAGAVRASIGASDANFLLYQRGLSEPTMLELGRLIDLLIVESARGTRKARMVQLGTRDPATSSRVCETGL
jgi:hypothetical protein